MRAQLENITNDENFLAITYYLKWNLEGFKVIYGTSDDRFILSSEVPQITST